MTTFDHFWGQKWSKMVKMTKNPIKNTIIGFIIQNAVEWAPYQLSMRKIKIFAIFATDVANDLGKIGKNQGHHVKEH